LRGILLICLVKIDPVWDGYLLNYELERLEDEGSISKFKSRISRIEKHHYRMELEVSLTEEQTRKGFSNLFKNPPVV